MAEKKKTLKQMEADYEALAKRCAGFDGETKAMLRDREAETKKLIAERKKAREKLLALKLVAFRALNEARAGAPAAVPAKDDQKPPAKDDSNATDPGTSSDPQADSSAGEGTGSETNPEAGDSRPAGSGEGLNGPLVGVKV